MTPFKSLLSIDKLSATPAFVQLSDQLVHLIRNGTLSVGQRLPGTRQMAALLAINRQTVVAGYDEATAQGWLESRPGSGTFVAGHLPDVQPQLLTIERNKAINQQNGLLNPGPSVQPGYAFELRTYLARPLLINSGKLHLDDGFPDIRLAPLAELGRAYRSYFRWGNPQHHFGYSDTKGHPLLREQLSYYLNETRGLHTTPDNVLITRGSIMGLHLASKVLLRPGDVVITGETTWSGATMNFRNAGAQVLTVPVDAYGIDVDALAAIAEKMPIRLVSVTPHHHYPTTLRSALTDAFGYYNLRSSMALPFWRMIMITIFTT
jgi:GntR family transcriptional regulator/MocR family aminotransferase